MYASPPPDVNDFFDWLPFIAIMSGTITSPDFYQGRKLAAGTEENYCLFKSSEIELLPKHKKRLKEKLMLLKLQGIDIPSI